MTFDPDVATKIAMAIGAGVAVVSAVIAMILMVATFLKACITRREYPAIEVREFWEGFKEGVRESVHWGPRRYFSPFVGAVAGIVDYTSAAWAKRPASTKRAETYSRLLSALTKEAVGDASYNKRLIEAVLHANGDEVRGDRLVGHLSDDLRAFGAANPTE